MFFLRNCLLRQRPAICYFRCTTSAAIARQKLSRYRKFSLAYHTRPCLMTDEHYVCVLFARKCCSLRRADTYVYVLIFLSLVSDSIEW